MSRDLHRETCHQNGKINGAIVILVKIVLTIIVIIVRIMTRHNNSKNSNHNDNNESYWISCCNRDTVGYHENIHGVLPQSCVIPSEDEDLRVGKIIERNGDTMGIYNLILMG